MQISFPVLSQLRLVQCSGMTTDGVWHWFHLLDL